MSVKAGKWILKLRKIGILVRICHVNPFFSNVRDKKNVPSIKTIRICERS